jgi:hypothetical protein
VDNITEKETAVNFDPVASSRTKFPMFFQMQPVLKILAQMCLFDGKVTSEVHGDVGGTTCQIGRQEMRLVASTVLRAW